MSNSSLTLHPHLVRRSTARPPYVYGTLDPTLTRTLPPITPGSVILTAIAILFGLYATGNLPFAEQAFDRFYAYSMQHNDAVVHAIVTAIPILLLLSALCLGGAVALLHLNYERRRQNAAGRILTRLPQPIAPPEPQLVPATTCGEIQITDPDLRLHRTNSKPCTSRVVLPTA